jgi:hypothetical protein
VCIPKASNNSTNVGPVGRFDETEVLFSVRTPSNFQDKYRQAGRQVADLASNGVLSRRPRSADDFGASHGFDTQLV